MLCSGTASWDYSNTCGPHLHEIETIKLDGNLPICCYSHNMATMSQIVWEPILVSYHVGGYSAADSLLLPQNYAGSSVGLNYHTALVLIGHLPTRWREPGLMSGWEYKGGEWEFVFAPPLEWPAYSMQEIEDAIASWQLCRLGKLVPYRAQCEVRAYAHK
jgi:hypothetical protein